MWRFPDLSTCLRGEWETYAVRCIYTVLSSKERRWGDCLVVCYKKEKKSLPEVLEERKGDQDWRERKRERETSAVGFFLFLDTCISIVPQLGESALKFCGVYTPQHIAAITHLLLYIPRTLTDTPPAPPAPQSETAFSFLFLSSFLLKDSTGEILHYHNFWVAVIDKEGHISRQNWAVPYTLVRRSEPNHTASQT